MTPIRAPLGDDGRCATPDHESVTFPIDGKPKGVPMQTEHILNTGARPTRLTPRAAFSTARSLLVIAALGAVVAAVGSFPAVTEAGPETLVVEIWRLAGYVLFSGLFALLAYRPVHYAGVWELVIANKLALTVAALIYAGGADGAREVALVDGVLTAVLLTAYLLSRGWQAWSTTSRPKEMAGTKSTTVRAPWRVRFFGRLLGSLLEVGVPLGPNRLVTIPGRKSGLPRTTPLAVIDVGGRRWVWAPWGEVNWVKNLRAAGRATLTNGEKREEVTATELNRAEREDFFRNVLGPKARSIPLGDLFIRIADGVDVNRPAEAADARRVFELHATN